MIKNKISHYGAKDGDLELALSRMLQGFPQRRLAGFGVEVEGLAYAGPVTTKTSFS